MRAFIFVSLLFVLVPLQAYSERCVDVRIDENFGPYNITRIKSGIDYWNLIGDLNLCPRVVHVKASERDSFMLDNIISIYDASEGWPEDEWKKSHVVKGNTLAYTTLRTGDIFVGNTDMLWKVTIHELGHSFGCSHTSNKWDIMYPIVSWNISAITRECRSLARQNAPKYFWRERE